SRGAVEVSCGAGGALRVRPAAESEWLTCGAGSRVSACGKYADLCRQRTARATTTTTTIATTTTANGQPKAVMAWMGSRDFSYALTDAEKTKYDEVYEQEKRKRKDSQAVPKNQVETQLPEHEDQETTGNLREEKRAEAEVPLKTVPEVKTTLQKESEMVVPLVSTVGQEELTNVAPTEPLLAGGKAAGIASPSVGSDLTKTETGQSEDVDPTKRNPQGESANSTETSQENVNHGSATQNPSPAAESTATPDTTAVSESQETNSTTLPSTENTTTETPTTTPSPSLVPSAEISSNIASTLQNKANVDSSLSPLWMRTAAPLLIVAMLFSTTVY
ncbi:uncharacterized protein TM35_000581190, partial [Trypanosoma theileri]